MVIRVPGVEPARVHLGQEPSGKGSRGLVRLGAGGDKRTLIVTTSGGSVNVARVPVRGVAERPSAFEGDIKLTARVDGLGTVSETLTVLKVDVDQRSTTLLNDMAVTRSITTTPPVPGLRFDFEFYRGEMVGNDGRPIDKARTHSSVHIRPLGGDAVISDADGTARFAATAGHGGQGRVFGKLIVDELGFHVPIDFDLTQPRSCTGCCTIDGADAEDTAGGAVGLYAGERTVCTMDLTIPGRGVDFQVTRSYRSQASHLRSGASGDFGMDWAMSYVDDRLIADGQAVVVFRSTLRTDVFVPSETGEHFISPMEFYEQLTLNVQGDWEIRDAHGMVWTYKGFRDPYIPGRLIRQEDRDGNYLSFLYGQPKGLSKNVLVTVVDTMGRAIHYRYYNDHDPNAGRRGRLREIEDFRRDNATTGRRVVFDYDAEGNLVEVTSPVVVGTPNGNDFPYGKTYRYGYLQQTELSRSLSESARGRLLHNLLTVQYPNQAAVDLDPRNPQTLPTGQNPFREVTTYAADPSDPATFDRVTAHTLGGTDGSGVPAGGTLRYDYELLETSGSTPNDPFLENRVTDRRGNLTAYIYSAFDTMLEKREYTRGLRAHEPPAFLSRYEYNRDKELVLQTLPEGNVEHRVFDDKNPDRFQQGNRIAWRLVPDAKRGGDQLELAIETIYEPIYQQPAAVVSSRGLDPTFVPPVSAPTHRSQRERYTTRYFFDYQEAPAAVILPLLAKELGTSKEVAGARLEAAGVVLGLGDLNGDGQVETHVHGDVIRMVAPSPALLSGGTQAAIEGDLLQDVVTLYRYNRFGQVVSTVDPEGNTDAYRYFPENDPDGDGAHSPPAADYRALGDTTGGYPREEVRDVVALARRNSGTDPVPVRSRTTYTYDDVGNRTSMTDGRGITDRFAINELNQVVQIIRAAEVPVKGYGDPPEPIDLRPFRYLEQKFYDFNNNMVQRRVEDRGNTSDTGGFVDHLTWFDILDQEIQNAEEVDVATRLITRYRYDRSGNRVLTIFPEGNAEGARYDERDLPWQVIRGVSTRPAAGLYAETDPTTFDRPGGAGTRPSITTQNYDGNENLVESVDAEPNGGAVSTRSGVGDVTRFAYDGFDREKATTDPLGNTMLNVYDPDGNVVRVITAGDPLDDALGGSPNKTLAITEFIHDSLSREIATHRVLFQTPDTKPVRRPELTDNERMDALAPYLADAAGDRAAVPGAGDVIVLGRISTITEYDRNGRTTFAIQDDLDSIRVDYDGIGRVVKTTDSAIDSGFRSAAGFRAEAISGNTVEMAYDDNDNLIEQKETDVSKLADLPPEVFRTTYVYDALGRVQTHLDNRGQALDYRYDSRDNLVAMADAMGPVTSQRRINRRGLGSSAAVTINDFGNVTRSRYDGANRLLETEVALTASGRGDGRSIGATLEGIADSLLPVDEEQSGDGLISTYYSYDDNGDLIALRDDNGNTTAYIYDNQNRLLTERKGLAETVTEFSIAGGDTGHFSVALRGGIAVRDTEPRGSDITLAYDRDDNRVTMSDEAGNVLRYDHDALNRRKRLDIARAPGFVGTTRQSWSHDGLSRLTRCSDNNEPADADDDLSCTYVYDSLSRQVEESQRIGALDPKTVSCDYDIVAARAVSRPSACSYPDGRRIENLYDGLDRLVRRRDQGQLLDIGRYDYLGESREAVLTYQNGTRLTHIGQRNGRDADLGFDNLRRVVDHRWETFEATTPLGAGRVTVAFGHRQEGDVPAYDRMNHKLIEEKLHDSGSSEVYIYDSAYRLTDPGDSYRGIAGAFKRGILDGAKTDLAAPTSRRGQRQREDWMLDGLGNWRSNSLALQGAEPFVERRTHTELNEIQDRAIGAATTTQRLDKNGNLLDSGHGLVAGSGFVGGRLRMQWDALNRIRALYDNNNTPDATADDVPLARLTYDCMNRRMRMQLAGGDPLIGTVDYYYAGWDVVEERDGRDDLLRQYVYGNGLDELWTLDDRRGGVTVPQLNDGAGDQRTFFQLDTLSSPHALTDETGSIVEAYQYNAYGLPTVWSEPGEDGRFFTDDDIVSTTATGVPTSKANNFRLYTGQYWLALDAAPSGLYYYKNRYHAPDLGRFASRDPIGYSGGTLNLYEYVASRPTSYRDPFGKWYKRNQHDHFTSLSFSRTYHSLRRTGRERCLGTYRCRENVESWLKSYNLRQDSGRRFANQRHFNRPIDNPRGSVAATWIAKYTRYIRGEAFLNFARPLSWRFPDKDDCVVALKALGRLTHSWQDYYAHALRLVRDDGALEPDKIVWTSAWQGVSTAALASPENPSGGSARIKPSSWNGWYRTGEHGWGEIGGTEGQARIRDAIKFVTQKYDDMIPMWLEKCCCYCLEIGTPD